MLLAGDSAIPYSSHLIHATRRHKNQILFSFTALAMRAYPPTSITNCSLRNSFQHVISATTSDSNSYNRFATFRSSNRVCAYKKNNRQRKHQWSLVTFVLMAGFRLQINQKTTSPNHPAVASQLIMEEFLFRMIFFLRGSPPCASCSNLMAEIRSALRSTSTALFDSVAKRVKDLCWLVDGTEDSCFCCPTTNIRTVGRRITISKLCCTLYVNQVLSLHSDIQNSSRANKLP